MRLKNIEEVDNRPYEDIFLQTRIDKQMGHLVK